MAGREISLVNLQQSIIGSRKLGNTKCIIQSHGHWEIRLKKSEIHAFWEYKLRW